MNKNNYKSFEKHIERTIDQLVYSQNPSEDSPFFPAHVHIEPTNTCNLRCIHCHHHVGSRDRGVFTRLLGFMKMELYEKIIEEISPKRCAITLNCQGEPCLHKNIIDMILKAKKRDIFVSLLTNGTKLDEILADELLKSGVDRVVFSFDAVEEDLYEKIRVNGEFNKVLSNINNFIDNNHKNGHKIFVCMSIIVQDATKDHIEEYKKYFTDRPVDTIFESNLLNLSGGTGVNDSFHLKGAIEIPKKEWPICRIPWENIVVNWDGAVTICPLDFNGKFIAGDINDNSLEDIWNNAKYRLFRRAHIIKDYFLLENNGLLCSECNCLWDPEYDFRNYSNFSKRSIVRNFNQINA